ncbi:carboxymuconolactone decarboxylase family protein [Amycolatopsis jejuensis]|uniref:carboxymuconolactone decarboxylase family protein n=1 Tax=Amycolatopsis jejuensis TaxID=330084 RepID=UPI0005274127|nr:carboxymuconolactone decarboxylase family protein [Amycolatopsis jejuensis]
MPAASSPRIPPLELDEMEPEHRKLAKLGADTVIQVLARAPELMNASSQLGAYLLGQGKLHPRIRELAILRVALRCDAPYEWANHAPAALGGGATEAEIVAVSDPDASWPPEDDAVLRAVDELCADVCVSDATWAALAETHDHAEIIEILFLVGYYRMMAGFLNSAGVSVKPGQPALGEPPTPVRAATDPDLTRPSSGKTGPDGSWKITFTHPAGSKDLLLDLATDGTTMSGSIFDGQLGVTVPIVSGTVDGQDVTLTALVTDPARFEVSVAGTVNGDAFAGSVTISGGGTFPLSGIRTG